MIYHYFIQSTNTKLGSDMDFLMPPIRTQTIQFLRIKKVIIKKTKKYFFIVKVLDQCKNEEIVRVRVLAIKIVCGQSRGRGTTVMFETCHGVSPAKPSQFLSPAPNSAQVRRGAHPPCAPMASLPEVQSFSFQLSIKTHLEWQEGGSAVMHFSIFMSGKE